MDMRISMADQSPHDSQGRHADRSDAGSSLHDRAAKAARAELRGERAGILGALGLPPLPALMRPRHMPERWSFIHVMERLEEAFRTLGRLPMPTRPRGYINSMPFYLYDRADLNSQLETYELERMARLIAAEWGPVVGGLSFWQFAAMSG
jgi:hypothetical protein